jgi:Ca-activated chloride channel family protein
MVMRRKLFLIAAMLVASLTLLWARIPYTYGQTRDQDSPYTLTVPVNEVSIIFHVSDARGSSLDNVTQEDLQLLDSGKPQKRLLSLRSYRNLPIRAGFLFDTSQSMLADLDHNASIANLYATQLLRKEIDRAFVMGFDTETRLTQEWTDKPEDIALGIRSIPGLQGSGDSGTAIFDSLYKTCRDRWQINPGAVTGNFILLFTDGIDNASHARLDDVIDMCQRTRTAIYIFTNQWNSRGTSRGGRTLTELVAKSGGRLFLNPSDEQIARDVQMIDSDQRSQYQLVYKPSDLKPDGSFHRVRLRCLIRGSDVLTRSGYYAPGRP